MSILASRLMNQAPGVILQNVHEVFTRTAMQVCEGQQIDMNFEQRLTVSKEEYLNMIELKTAVLVAASLKIGSILGGASQTEAEDLYEFGRNLGIAFQLQDDLLDTYGDPDLVVGTHFYSPLIYENLGGDASAIRDSVFEPSDHHGMVITELVIAS